LNADTSRTGAGARGPRYETAQDLERRRTADALPLAVVRFGSNRAAFDPPWLEARVPNDALAPDPAAEVWPAAGAVERFDLDGAPCASDGASLFVALEAVGAAGKLIEIRTFELYRRLLAGLERAGFPHLLRVWNFVPRINDDSPGLEQYMLFCKGRADAFATHCGAGFLSRLPASSAVGCPGDALVVHVLASREPGRHVENPRQVSAYRYPERYGPRSPSFARGTVAPATWHGRVFVSGTASIVGHESVHLGDPSRQAEETMANIEAVLDTAGAPGAGRPLAERLDGLRVYARFPDQLDAIRNAVARCAGGPVATAWLQAEVCRKELLVEIEAISRPR
jgi:chorismate lyase/3-hydroxybenzoate synthase